MPQLDKVTFLSQFFWLCVFYLGFYLIIFKFYLPKISRILALRKKKLAFSQQGMMSLLQENQQLREKYQHFLSRVLVASKTLFHNFFSHTTHWLESTSITISKLHYQNVNTSYVQSLGETSLSQNLLFHHAEKNIPEKLAFKVLLDTIENLKSKSLTTPLKDSAQEVKKKKKIRKHHKKFLIL